MAEKDDSEKTEEPSQYRLEEFRKKGQVAASREVVNVLILAATFLTLLMSFTYILEVLEEYIRWVYSLDANKILQVAELAPLISKTFVTILKCAGPVLIVALVFGIASYIGQIGFIFAPDVLGLKLERLNPLEGVKRLFSMKSIIEVIKSIIKFIIVITITYYVLKKEIPRFTGFLHIGLFESFLYGKAFLGKLSFLILLGLTVVAALDFAYEKYSYRQKLLLSKQESKEEAKEKEGNPEIKQRIKSLQRQMSQKRMMQKIPKADVIVTNPTHISVALKYDSTQMVAPKVIAKGSDLVALRIRELAKKHNIPMVENIPLARTLHKTVKIGESVPRNLYQAVAEVLAFVYKLRRKRK